MKKFLSEMWVLLPMVFVLFPWLLGFVDGLSIFLVGSQLTGIPWTADGGWRIASGTVWPIIWLIVATGMVV